MGAARTALWARVGGLRREDVARALWRERRLVKTWTLRGTLHLLPAADLPVALAAIRGGVLRGLQGWAARSGMSPARIDQTIDAIARALADGPLTRSELTERVVARLGPTSRRWLGDPWGGLVRAACLEGRVCFGPDRGREVTFVARETWIPRWREVAPGAAEVELLRRYLRGFGPANASDMAAWSGMAVSGVQRALRRAAPELTLVSWGGRSDWLLREDVKTLLTPRAPGPPRLLPSFDTLLLGYRDKGALVEDRDYKRVYRKAGWLSPVVLLDGRVAGVWSSEVRRGCLAVTVQSFTRMPGAVREEIAVEATSLGRFLGEEVEVAYKGPSGPGP